MSNVNELSSRRIVEGIGIVDFSLLAKQKNILLNINPEVLSKQQQAAMDGIIGLIDSIQDKQLQLESELLSQRINK